MKVKFLRLSETAKIPEYAHPTDSGMDLFSDEEIIIPARGYKLVHTGVSVILPANTEGQVRSKSGLALKFGLQVLNSPGTIDTNYRGEIGVILNNVSDTDYVVQKGQKIAQLVICPFYTCEIEETDTLDETDRNTGGFGSTGLK
ncbi:MAG: dUTP diphosphatase [Clostridia bacterium]|nr:dUTP diphosphatase [Clostridia bacterium]